MLLITYNKSKAIIWAATDFYCSCPSSTTTRANRISKKQWEISSSLTEDPSDFTQGLFWSLSGMGSCAFNSNLWWRLWIWWATEQCLIQESVRTAGFTKDTTSEVAQYHFCQGNIMHLFVILILHISVFLFFLSCIWVSNQSVINWWCILFYVHE